MNNVVSETKIDIKSLTLAELTDELKRQGEKAFRAKQMYEWMHVKLARSFEEMTNLSKAFREACEEKYIYTSLEAAMVQESKIDGTKKFLFRLADGNMVHQKVFVCALGWQCGGKRLDEVQAWEQRLYFIPSGMQNGMPFLCIHFGWVGA